MQKLAVYIHGKGGSADEAEHYQALFPVHRVLGFAYRSQTPWEAREEFPAHLAPLNRQHGPITLIANSLGAYLAMNAGIEELTERAYFISPIVDMEKLIGRMLTWAKASEDELKAKGVIATDFGEELSWDYLAYVRKHPLKWNVPTAILYGGRDELTDYETIAAFARQHSAQLTVMENGEHWFHTEEHMAFLDSWLGKHLPN
ncbi:alpha/beta hydrolase [bacterium]|nr:alpha/beta hydrolase [bacterium]